MEPVLKLRRFLETRPPSGDPGARCDFCAGAMGEVHSHMVDVEKRALLCVCRPCFLLFMKPGAGGARFRTVPERYLRAGDLAMTQAQWDGFQIPVGIAFFFHSSSAGRVLVFYPSPAGATESTLPPGVWDEVVAANPLLESLSCDVEAVLVRKDERRFEAYVVPIDACYELVGRIRRNWRGFHGGDETWREIDNFFSVIGARAEASA
jgi:hypothetical protein